MIKKQTLQSMSCVLDKGLLFGLSNNDPIPRKISAFSNNYNHIIKNNNAANFRLSLKGCGAEFGEKVPNLRSEDDVYGFYRTRAFTVSHQIKPLSELGLRDRNVGSDGGGGGEILDVNNYDGRSLPEKVVVAVDVDEVLGNFVSALNRFIADHYSSSHSVSEYHVYEFFKIWKCSRDEADIRVHEFFKTPYFKNGIYPLPGAQITLKQLSRFCNLSVVTSRQNVIKDHTLEWLEKHYPGLFDEIHFGNHFALHGASRPKSEICRSIGAKVLIDDNPRYALECAEVGIRVLLFDYENSYPWCKTGSGNQHPLVTKVHNWREVEQQLVSWIFSSHL